MRAEALDPSDLPTHAEAIMSGLIFLLVTLDCIVLIISFAQFREAWANEACLYVMPLCDYPNALIAFAVILVGLHFAVRA